MPTDNSFFKNSLRKFANSSPNFSLILHSVVTVLLLVGNVVSDILVIRILVSVLAMAYFLAFMGSIAIIKFQTKLMVSQMTRLDKLANDILVAKDIDDLRNLLLQWAKENKLHEA